jgi:hypothetical protein
LGVSIVDAAVIALRIYRVRLHSESHPEYTP